jgi:hypothetical protein
VTHEELADVLERAPEAFVDLIAVAYLTGARQTDLITWKRTEVLKLEGIDYVESKTGKRHIISLRTKHVR